MFDFHRRRRLTTIAVAASALAIGWGLAAPVTASAASPPGPPFTQCPAIGASPGCEILLVVNPDNTVTVLKDPSVGPFDGGDDTLVGIVNDSSAAVKAVTVSGPGSGLSGFDGDGICSGDYGTWTGSSGCPYGSTGYEGPGTSFVTTASLPDSAEVDFTGGLAPGKQAYFSLEGALATATLTARNGPLLIRYVALGDSYSSGEGNPSFLPGTNTTGRNADQCHRSYVAYPELIDQDPALDIASFAFRACSGATSSELEWGFPANHEDAQVNHITSQTNLVTIGVGGDDVGFRQVLTWCITGPPGEHSSDCSKMQVLGVNGGWETLAKRETELINKLGEDIFCYAPTGYYECQPSLHAIYEDIASRAASGVRIIVLLYPHLFTNDPASTGCHLAGGDGWVARISKANMVWLNQGVDQLDAKIISEVRIAQKAGLNISYVDPRPDWSDTSGNASPGGHGVCTTQPWINGLILQPTLAWLPVKPSVYSFHPNALGQQEFAALIEAQL